MDDTKDRLPVVVVVGGGYAGVLAANRVAGRLGGRARVVLVSDRDELVHRVRLHEMASGGDARRYPLARMVARRVERVQARVVRIDAAARRCVLEDGVLAYDFLIYAVGSGIAAAAPGAREHGMALASPDHALAFAAKLDALPIGAPIVVIGGGLSGIEVAAEIAERHPALAVSILCDTLGTGWDDVARDAALAGLSELGVTVRTGARVAEVHADAVVLTTGERVDAAATVWAAGFAASRLARDSGLPCDASGRLVVGETLQVPSHPEILGAGDGVAPPAACVSGADPDYVLRMGCVTAMPLGCHAADVAADLVRGKPPRTFRFAFPLQCVSLGRKRGLLVLTDRRDHTTGRVVTGRVAAMVKELICRYVIGMVRVERRFALYPWLGKRSSRRLLTAPTPRALPAASGDTHVA
jgi:NADH:ubiquinone reductase (H+-translocating)